MGLVIIVLQDVSQSESASLEFSAGKSRSLKFFVQLASDCCFNVEYFISRLINLCIVNNPVRRPAYPRSHLTCWVVFLVCAAMLTAFDPCSCTDP